MQQLHVYPIFIVALSWIHAVRSVRVNRCSRFATFWTVGQLCRCFSFIVKNVLYVNNISLFNGHAHYWPFCQIAEIECFHVITWKFADLGIFNNEHFEIFQIASYDSSYFVRDQYFNRMMANKWFPFAHILSLRYTGFM